MTRTVRDIIDSIRKYHLALAERYVELAGNPSQPEKVVKVILYLRDREHYQAYTLEQELERSDYSNILNTWVKEGPDEPSEQLKMDVSEQLPNQQYSTETLASACSTQHHSIENVYEQLLQTRHSESAKDYFNSLLVSENTELRNKMNMLSESELL